MNTSRILMAVLATFLLNTQPILAANQRKPNTSNIVDHAKKEWREFKKAVSCLRKKGFRKCSRSQKARIIGAGIALAAVSAATIYVVKPRTLAQQARLNNDLDKAIFKGKIEDVQRLITRGAEIDTRMGGNAPLHTAVSHKKEDIVRFLISQKADVNQRNSSYLTPLDLATGSIKQFLEEHTDAKTDDQLRKEGK